MKYIITYLFVFAFSLSFGQNQRFTYKGTTLSSDSLKTEKLYLLDIKDNQSLFYPRIYFENDSINKRADSEGGYVATVAPFYKSENQKVSYYEHIVIDSYEVPLKEKIQWKITNQTKQWEDYLLQKATTNYGGRTWEAWFTNEIPISEGPLFLKGLPGLITEVKDSENHYHFELVKTEKGVSEVKSLSLIQKDSIKINAKQFKKLKKQHYKSPLAFFYKGGVFKKGKKGMLEDGTVISNMAEVKQAEKSERNRIKKDNNPAYLNFKVDYN